MGHLTLCKIYQICEYYGTLKRNSKNKIIVKTFIWKKYCKKTIIIGFVNIVRIVKRYTFAIIIIDDGSSADYLWNKCIQSFGEDKRDRSVIENKFKEREKQEKSAIIKNINNNRGLSSYLPVKRLISEALRKILSFWIIKQREIQGTRLS